jgi:uncharacterized surface protein with fasciclin (FAS1) repeats
MFSADHTSPIPGAQAQPSLDSGKLSRFAFCFFKLPRIRSFHPHYIQCGIWPVLPVQTNCDVSVERKISAMKKNVLTLLFALIFSLTGVHANAQKDPMVGGAAMYPTKNIVENAVNSKDHTTLVAAVKAAGLVETLEGPGPFTVFAPTNEAFAALPAGTVDTLLKPENKPTLVKILTYHVVPGRLTTKDLKKMIKQGGGKAELKTVQGGTLTVTMKDAKYMLTDEKGGTAMITIPNVIQSNGVIQVINAVLMPN